MGFAFMCAEKLFGLFKKRVRPDKKRRGEKTLSQYDKTNYEASEEVSRKQSPRLESTDMVVYVPGTPQERYHRDPYGQGRQTRFQPVMTGTMDFPPHIQLSKDGEEGYPISQKLLNISCDTSGEIERECIRSPPNVTIFDSKSPEPSYLSQSVNLLDKHGGKGQSRVIADNCGSPMLDRCCSLSNNNNTNHSDPKCHRTFHSAGHTRHGSGSSGNSSSSERPPEYSEVIPNLDVYGGNTGSV